MKNSEFYYISSQLSGLSQRILLFEDLAQYRHQADSSILSYIFLLPIFKMGIDFLKFSWTAVILKEYSEIIERNPAITSPSSFHILEGKPFGPGDMNLFR